MKIIISNTSKAPIYEQIYTQMKNLIMEGEWGSGQALPSMRQLAKDLQVSLITTKRTYEELEKNGYIFSIVGKGSFVSDQNNEMIKEGKKKAVEEQLMTAIKNSKDIGITLPELKELLTLLYQEGE
ncbi:GntR family transcriptional regulator [Pontibacillus halophilus JSM 076056 = DSM 19796]|uniref:GntR family transcriptional regulator n=1 Tax=Pontibacillus halophilus JSM 076056 = DSM 19796 TaxID=1385510 RepID=A0A0A5GGI1_9BACI|nr:GntR family transcriptional regulator [Pontibacillus halophilus]KGX91089.1 GntR family transcriptional regulator [Pontibacillus halophilus JSM 076056 = DSM 19796]